MNAKGIVVHVFRKADAFAQKASAISVTRPGAQSSVPFRKEIK